MKKRGYSIKLAILLSVAMSSVLLLAEDSWAGCKWFKVCGYTPGATLPLIVSSDPGCSSVNGISIEVDSFGCGSFKPA